MGGSAAAARGSGQKCAALRRRGGRPGTAAALAAGAQPALAHGRGMGRGQRGVPTSERDPAQRGAELRAARLLGTSHGAGAAYGGNADLPPDLITWNTLGSKSTWAHALMALAAARRGGLQPSLVSFAAKGPWRAAAALCQAMRQSGLQGNRISSNGLLGICASEGQWRFCLEILSGLEPDTLSFSSCASASEKGHQWMPALRLVQSSVQQGCAADMVLHSAALSSCEKCHRWRLAMSLLDRNCLELPQDVDLIAFNAVISACAKDGQWQWALHVLRRIRGRLRANVVSINAAISACEKGGVWEVALELLRGMPRQALEPELQSFNSAMSAAARGRRWEEWHWLSSSPSDLGKLPAGCGDLGCCSHRLRGSFALGLGLGLLE
ncbi:unnamed protein product [Effrenium voratum]|nr:unnamed protein product [Effrenium voratum]